MKSLLNTFGLSIAVLLAGRLVSSSSYAREPNQVAIYTVATGGLSVSEESQALIDGMRDRFLAQFKSGEVTRIELDRIGLEGQSRICVEFVDDARAAAAYASAVAAAGPGINVRGTCQD